MGWSRANVLVVQAVPRPTAAVLHLLDSATRVKLHRPRPSFGEAADRRRDGTASAHALLRLLLSELTHVAPQDHGIDRICATCGGVDHGRPVLRDSPLHVSLASTRTAVAVAISPDAPVGVDVEQVDGTRFDGFAGVALGPLERVGDDRQRARAWVRKEAVLKARGTGLAVEPRSVDVRADRTDDGWVLDVPVEPGLAAAVAVIANRRPHLRVEWRDLSR